MPETLHHLFLEFETRKLQQLMGRIKDCLGRLTNEQIWMRGGDSSNAVGNLVLHLRGNVRQWIIASLGGETDIRVRDLEFTKRGGVEGAELADSLEGVVKQAVGVIAGLTPERLAERVVIQKYDVSVLEAVAHVVEHFAQHTGQIIFATKLLTGEETGYYTHLSGSAPKPDKAGGRP